MRGSKTKQLGALVIGAGKIGAFLDDPKRKEVLTHAHGYAVHPKFNLVGFVDTRYARAQRAAKVWGGNAYRMLEDAFAGGHVDVISLCTPEDDHYRTLQQLKRFRFRGGILEKALTDKLSTAQKIARDPFFARKPFPVNYMRRYVPEFRELRGRIERGSYGPFVTGSMHYGKGILRNGSHLIDLLRFFGFEVSGVRTISKLNDFYKEDASYGCALSVRGGGYVDMHVVPGKLYRLIEMDLIFERGRVRVLESGFVIEEYGVAADKVFPGYRVLERRRTQGTSFAAYMRYVVDDLYRSIVEKSTPLCSVVDAYEAQKLCHAIARARIGAQVRVR